METPSSNLVRRALAEGAERSRAAARPSATAPLPSVAPVAPVVPVVPVVPVASAAPEPLRLALWRRHKWKIYGLLFLLLTELCLLLLGKTLAMGPG